MYESNSNRLGTLCMGALGVYIGLPPRGTMVIWMAVGPGCQCHWSPASPPAAGARRLVGPADWSGTEPTGRLRRLRVWSAADYCSRNANDAYLVGEGRGYSPVVWWEITVATPCLIWLMARGL